MSEHVEEYIRFRIQDCRDRENIVVSLANSGYKVWVRKEKNGVFDVDYYVCVVKP